MRKVKLSNCGDFILTPKLSTNELSPNNYITTDNMLPNKAGIEKISNIPSNLNVTQFVKNDILLSNIRPYFKKIWLAKFSGGCSADVLIFRTNNNYDSSYIKYCLSQDSFFIYNMAGAKGSKMPRGDKQHILNFELLDFDLMTQKKIGNLLKAIDEKIDLNNKLNSELEKTAKELYDYWFVQFDFPDEKERPYKSSGGKMVYSQELKREIPFGWEVIVLGEHITSLRGVSYSSPDLIGDGVPMINLACFTPECTYKASGIKSYSGKYTKDKVLKPYDLVMCNTQQTDLDPTKDIIGNCLLVPNIFDKEIVSSHHVNHIIFDNDDLKYILFGESKTTWFHKFVSGLCSGTNILGLDFNGVCKYKIVKPPKQILAKYAKLILYIESQKSVIIKENQQLTTLRDFLLPLLMNGQVSFKK